MSVAHSCETYGKAKDLENHHILFKQAKHSVEKIGGTSMTQFDVVLKNIFLRPENPYQRIFVVSAYAGVTDALLESKRGATSGIFGLIAKDDNNWKQAFEKLEDQLIKINRRLLKDDPNSLNDANHFIFQRIAKAKTCIENIMATCQYGQFSLEQYLPQIREFLSAIGESHSAYNSCLILSNLGINTKFVDLSGWASGTNEDTFDAGQLDQVILESVKDIDLSDTLPIVTGYVYCDEGLMKTYDRGYSEMTFSRLAVLTNANKAIIHKEYHLSTADPKIAGREQVEALGQTNFDVADQLANLGMEAIHPNAAAGLRKANIDLIIKNTFEPEHQGTLISNRIQPQNDKVEIIAGKEQVFALHLFDQNMLGEIDQVGTFIFNLINQSDIQLIGKEMNANSVTYYLDGKKESHLQILSQVKKQYQNAEIKGAWLAFISIIGASMNTNEILTQGMNILMKKGVYPRAAHTSIRNVDVQFVVNDEDYESSIESLHQFFVEMDASEQMEQTNSAILKTKRVAA